MIFMKIFKRNQIIIYVLALMLVAAGYLNYTTTLDTSDTTIQTSFTEEEMLSSKNIGDAQLVSSIVSNNSSINNNEVNNIVSENNSESNNSIETNSSLKKDNDYFESSKLERDAMYSQMIETYEKILNSNNSLETQKQSATEEITKINNIKNSIMICENLIKTKGFENNIIFVNGESVSVVIGADNLTQETVAQIQNIISRELGSSADKIHISKK